MPEAIASVIGLALFSAGVALPVVNAVTFATLFLVNTAVTVGLSLAANLIFRPGAPQAQTVKPSDVQTPIKQAVPARMRSYGTVKIAGVIWWLDTTDSGTTSTLFIGVALNQGRIAAFLKFFIDVKEVTLSAGDNGSISTAPYNALSRCQVTTNLGKPSEVAYSRISSQFSVSKARGDGVATALVEFANATTSQVQAEDFPTGIPIVRFVIQAQTVWDPRAASQDREDETTYAFSENPVVCLLHFMLDPDGFAMPWSRIEPNLAEWIEAMDVCDEQVLSISAGGYEPRYKVAGTYLFSDKPAAVLSRFLSACDGRCWQRRDGTVGIRVGRFYEPTVVIRNVDIIEADLDSGRDPFDAVAGIRAQYMSPAHDYREQDADPWPSGEVVIALGEERVAPLDLTWTPSHSMARRLMKRQYVRETGQWHGTIRTKAAGLRAIDERFIRLQIAELDLDATFEVGRLSIDLGGPIECTMEVLQVGSDIDEWDPTTEEGTPPGATVLVALGPIALAASGHNGAYTAIRQVVAGVALLASGTQARLTIGYSRGIDITMARVTIAPRSGSTDAATTTPTPVTFAGAVGFNNLAVSNHGAVTSDWIAFPITAGVDYLVCVDFDLTQDLAEGDAGSGSGSPATYFYSDGPGAANIAPGVLAASVNDHYYFLSEIEVRGG